MGELVLDNSMQFGYYFSKLHGIMIQRQAEPTALELANSFPVVTITGPRQSGKTTLAKMVFPHKNYVSLENPNTRQFAESDPLEFLEQYPEGVIIDEIQRVPSLLSYIQTIVSLL